MSARGPPQPRLIKKKIDPRLRTLIENGVKQRYRTFFVVVGDRGKEQVVNLHYMLSKSVVKARPSVLWCYKKLQFTSHQKKRQQQVKKRVQRGTYDPEKDDPFELFLSSTLIRYTKYKESHKILGNTYGMCVLQDFEAMTPNLLARTIETVEGGGIVVLLLATMKSLKQLYSMSMDVHTRFRTESQHEVTGRFNERFLLSLSSCTHCLVVDDELNILPISTKSRSIKPVLPKVALGSGQDESKELTELKSSLKETEFVGTLVNTSKTIDQAKAILTFIDALCEKTLRTTVAMTAARGRGKSAALGIAIAYAVASGYSNIFVTSPSPENLKTLFEFIFKGFDVLQYAEHLDYEIVQSTNPDFNKSIVRVNIFRDHRQTIQYIHPQDSGKLGQAELVVIDEAAAIPLPYVKRLLGPYLVFMSSTVNGYEGTGRSLSLKLLDSLRQQSGTSALSADEERLAGLGEGNGKLGSGRNLREISLQTPIRYEVGDPIEKWLNELLCLDSSIVSKLKTNCPHPSDCSLFYVNRDTLFSYHKASEMFLQRMMGLYVSSHYKNTPNDLLLMSDAPAHHLFVLLGPVDEKTNKLPEILSVVQVAIEGELSRETIRKSLERGIRESGDLIPWTISQQFQDDDFASLSGARVVRIATHPDYMKMGYGSRSIDLLKSYYKGEFTILDKMDEDDSDDDSDDNKSKIKKEKKNDSNHNKKTHNIHEINEIGKDNLLNEVIKPRGDLPPLLQRLDERKAEPLQWIGVSYGVTESLYNFWFKNKFYPCYLRQTANDLTGEHSCIMLHALTNSVNPQMEIDYKEDWLELFFKDFKRRFLSLLGFEFSNFKTSLALSILDYNQLTFNSKHPQSSISYSENNENEEMTKSELDFYLLPWDLKRLESYTKRIVDYHIIVDLLPVLAKLYFLAKLKARLNFQQAAILLGTGLQHKSFDFILSELGLPRHQMTALFNQGIKKIAKEIRRIEENEIEENLPLKEDTRFVNVPISGRALDEELDEAGDLAAQVRQQKQLEMLSALGPEYKIEGSDADWERDLGGKNKRKKPPGSISVRTKVAGETQLVDLQQVKRKKQKENQNKFKKPKTKK